MQLLHLFWCQIHRNMCGVEGKKIGLYKQKIWWLPSILSVFRLMSHPVGIFFIIQLHRINFEEERGGKYIQGSHSPCPLPHITFRNTLGKMGDGKCSGFIIARMMISKKLLKKHEELKSNIWIFFQTNCHVFFCLQLLGGENGC